MEQCLRLLAQGPSSVKEGVVVAPLAGGPVSPHDREGLKEWEALPSLPNSTQSQRRLVWPLAWEDCVIPEGTSWCPELSNVGAGERREVPEDHSLEVATENGERRGGVAACRVSVCWSLSLLVSRFRARLTPL